MQQLIEAMASWKDDWSTTSFILGVGICLIACFIIGSIDRAWRRHLEYIMEGRYAADAMTRRRMEFDNE